MRNPIEQSTLDAVHQRPRILYIVHMLHPAWHPASIKPPRCPPKAIHTSYRLSFIPPTQLQVFCDSLSLCTTLIPNKRNTHTLKNSTNCLYISRQSGSQSNNPHTSRSRGNPSRHILHIQHLLHSLFTTSKRGIDQSKYLFTPRTCTH